VCVCVCVFIVFCKCWCFLFIAFHVSVFLHLQCFLLLCFLLVCAYICLIDYGGAFCVPRVFMLVFIRATIALLLYVYAYTCLACWTFVGAFHPLYYFVLSPVRCGALFIVLPWLAKLAIFSLSDSSVRLIWRR
jgi:hypothetical protein